MRKTLFLAGALSIVLLFGALAPRASAQWGDTNGYHGFGGYYRYSAWPYNMQNSYPSSNFQNIPSYQHQVLPRSSYFLPVMPGTYQPNVYQPNRYQPNVYQPQNYRGSQFLYIR